MNRKTSEPAGPVKSTAGPSSDANATAPDERYRAPALDKGLDILELLAQQAQGLTRAEIVKEMDRSASEIYRMLERLVARKYVTRSLAGDRYALSLKLFALATAHPPLNRLINQALPVMEAFTRQAEQSCHLGVYDRGQVLIIAQVNSPEGWSFSLQRGARLGLQDTASGQVLLAFSSAADSARMHAVYPPQNTDATTNDAHLAAMLSKLRAQGYLERDSQQCFGVVDLSFPILGPDKHAVAALTCPYVRRIDREAGLNAQQARELLRESARALSQDMLAAGQPQQPEQAG